MLVIHSISDVLIDQLSDSIAIEQTAAERFF